MHGRIATKYTVASRRSRIFHFFSYENINRCATDCQFSILFKYTSCSCEYIYIYGMDDEHWPCWMNVVVSAPIANRTLIVSTKRTISITHCTFTTHTAMSQAFGLTPASLIECRRWAMRIKSCEWPRIIRRSFFAYQEILINVVCWVGDAMALNIFRACRLPIWRKSQHLFLMESSRKIHNKMRKKKKKKYSEKVRIIAKCHITAYAIIQTAARLTHVRMHVTLTVMA